MVNKRGGGISPFVREMFGEDLHGATNLANGHVEPVMSKAKGPCGPRPRHSFSQLAYFLQCPMRYKLAVIYGFRSPWLDPVGYGANVHRALEEIHRRAAEGKISAKEDVADIVGQTWVSNRRTNPKREEDYRRSAIKHIEEYVETHRDSLSLTLQAETSFSFALQDHVMLGKIDLMRSDKNGGIEIVDFKTSKSDQFELEKINLQLEIYALGAEESLHKKVEKTTVHFLGDGKVRPSSWSADRKREAAIRLADVLKKIENEEFLPNCDYCIACEEFREICPNARK